VTCGPRTVAAVAHTCGGYGPDLPVDDIESAVDELRAAGVNFGNYDNGPLATDEKGIATPGPKQAWFRDPAGNILSVIED